MQLPLFEGGKKKITLGEAKPSELVISKYNPRLSRDEAKIKELAQLIKGSGYDPLRALKVYRENKHYEIFAGGNRLLAANLACVDPIPIAIYEGYSTKEIWALAYRDNTQDGQYCEVPITDVWADYARRRDEGLTQQEIAETLEVNQARISERLKWNDSLPPCIKELIQQGKLDEGHLREITNLFIVEYFSSWLTTSQLWTDLAEKASNEKMSVRETKKEVDRWKKIIELAEEYYNKLPDVEQYDPKGEFVKLLAEKEAKTQKAIQEVYKEIMEEIERLEELRAIEHEKKMNEARRKEIEAEEERKRIELEQKFEPKIYWGDFEKSSDEIPDESIDLIFADPWYGISDGGTTAKNINGKLIQGSVNKDKEDSPQEINYNWVSICYKKLKPEGSIYVSGTLHNIFDLALELRRVGFKIVNDIIWEKPVVNPQLVPNQFAHNHETILFAIKSNKYYFAYEELKKFNEGKQLRDVWQINRPHANELIHPTQKPEELLEIIITASCPTEGIILDPFLGSGTTCAVAKRLFRKSIGFEKNLDLKEMVEARLDSVKI